MYGQPRITISAALRQHISPSRCIEILEKLKQDIDAEVAANATAAPEPDHASDRSGTASVTI